MLFAQNLLRLPAEEEAIAVGEDAQIRAVAINSGLPERDGFILCLRLISRRPLPIPGSMKVAGVVEGDGFHE